MRDPPKRCRHPCGVTFLALASDASSREREWQHVRDLAARFGVALPAQALNHLSADLGPFRIKFERHSEFARYKFIAPGVPRRTVRATRAQRRAGRLARGPVRHRDGRRARGARRRRRDRDATGDALATSLFDGNILIGSGIADGAGDAFTDFRLYDGCSRFLRAQSHDDAAPGRPHGAAPAGDRDVPDDGAARRCRSRSS